MIQQLLPSVRDPASDHRGALLPIGGDQGVVGVAFSATDGARNVKGASAECGLTIPRTFTGGTSAYCQERDWRTQPPVLP